MLRQITGNAARFLPTYFPVASLATRKTRKVAMVLSGCGVYDGTEVHEAAYMLAHLTRLGVEPLFYAPDVCQLHVIDHVKGVPREEETRNVLIESARVSRGTIQLLNKLQASCADGLVFPGGFGVAKNLSDFAVNGADCSVHEEVERVLKEFHKAKKPIGLCCIAPVLAARVLGNVTITLGKCVGPSWPHASAIEQVRKMGARIELKNVNEIAYDAKNNIVTTPAFMYDGEFHEIYDGIGTMIRLLVRQMK